MQFDTCPPDCIAEGCNLTLCSLVPTHQSVVVNISISNLVPVNLQHSVDFVLLFPLNKLMIYLFSFYFTRRRNVRQREARAVYVQLSCARWAVVHDKEEIPE